MILSSQMTDLSNFLKSGKMFFNYLVSKYCETQNTNTLPKMTSRPVIWGGIAHGGFSMPIYDPKRPYLGHGKNILISVLSITNSSNGNMVNLPARIVWMKLLPKKY